MHYKEVILPFLKLKNSPKYFTCGEKHEIWHTYLSDNTVSKIIIGHRDFRHFQDGCH
jgi:hypothetical protein